MLFFFFFLVASICSSSQPWKFFFSFVLSLQLVVKGEELMNWSGPIFCHVVLDVWLWAFNWQHAYLQMMSASTRESIDFSAVKRGLFSMWIMEKKIITKRLRPSLKSSKLGAFWLLKIESTSLCAFPKPRWPVVKLNFAFGWQTAASITIK